MMTDTTAFIPSIWNTKVRMPDVPPSSNLKRTRPVQYTKQDVLRVALDNPIETVRILTQKSLFHFIKYFWDTYSEDEFVPNWHIEVLCEELEIVARRVAANEVKLYDLIFNVPPGTTKTAVVSIFFPVWCWVNWYWMRFITTSHSDALSLESAEYSRDIIRSEKFQVIFPDIDIKQDKDTKSNFRVVKKEFDEPGRAPRIKSGGGRVSTSVGSKIIGFHAHIIIPDDLIDAKGVLSAVILKNANQYLDHTLSTRKVDKRVTTMVMIMQRLAEDDPTGHMLAKEKKKIRLICLPGEIFTYREQVKPPHLISRYVNGLLDPVRMPPHVLEEMEADLGQYGYAGQVGQKPTPPGGGMFKVEKFSIIQKLPPEVSIVGRIRYWDKAGTSEEELSKGGDAAYTVGLLMYKTDYGKWIVVDVKRGRWETHDREDIIKATGEADGRDLPMAIEQEPGSGGKESMQNTVRNMAGFICHVDIPSGKGNKVQRADAFSVQVNHGNVQLLHGDWNKAFIDEYRFFPFGKYKDQVDAGSGAFNQLTQKREARMLGTKRR